MRFQFKGKRKHKDLWIVIIIITILLLYTYYEANFGKKRRLQQSESLSSCLVNVPLPNQTSPLSGQFPNDSGRTSSYHWIVGYIFSYYSPCSNDTTVPDRHPGTNHSSSSYPTIIADCNGLAMFGSCCAFPIIDRVHRSIQLYIRADQYIFP